MAFGLCFDSTVNASISDILNNDRGFVYIDNVGIANFNNMKYIENHKYFKSNPQHAENNSEDNGVGTCTTVAMQLLLGYHNYYSDRRLCI